MACGEFGPGRMSEPADIFAADPELSMATNPPSDQPGIPSGPLDRHARSSSTAGPTHEPIDPVRYIANRSSGKQGYALAEAAIALGAEVALVSGPVHLPVPPGVELINVRDRAPDARTPWKANYRAILPSFVPRLPTGVVHPMPNTR
jgi:phosphopantothenoylcysteine decarboxylase/phosphopantothenate--cysteine ligase